MPHSSSDPCGHSPPAPTPAASAFGGDAFACLSGYLATMRKQGRALLATLKTVFTGQPLYPDVL